MAHIGVHALYEIASDVLDEIKQRMFDGGLVELPERIGLYPGAIAWDACDCGMFLIAPTRQYFSENFPFEEVTLTATPCNFPWLVIEYIVQAIRCAPLPQEGQLFPSLVELESSAKTVIHDSYYLLEGTAKILCSLKENREIVDYRITELIVQGPEGGCVGSELRFSTAIRRG